MFEQSQVQEFKEAFGLMDQDRDGTISADDLSPKTPKPQINYILEIFSDLKKKK